MRGWIRPWTPSGSLSNGTIWPYSLSHCYLTFLYLVFQILYLRLYLIITFKWDNPAIFTFTLVPTDNKTIALDWVTGTLQFRHQENLLIRQFEQNIYTCRPGKSAQAIWTKYLCCICRRGVRLDRRLPRDMWSWWSEATRWRFCSSRRRQQKPAGNKTRGCSYSMRQQLPLVILAGNTQVVGNKMEVLSQQATKSCSGNLSLHLVHRGRQVILWSCDQCWFDSLLKKREGGGAGGWGFEKETWALSSLQSDSPSVISRVNISQQPWFN